MRACALNSLVVYSNVKTHDIGEGSMITWSEIQTENICSFRVWDIREGVSFRRLVLWSLEYVFCM